MKLFKGRETHTRSLMKAISWRITGSLDTFVISYFVTGKISLAGAIASVEVITKVALFYFHERAWTAIRWGQRVHGPQVYEQDDPQIVGRAETRAPS